MIKPAVVHAIRGYLSRTETFVGNQITSLIDHSPVVLCHHRNENREFDIDTMYVISENESGVQKSFGKLSYATMRSLTQSQIQSSLMWIKRHSPALMHYHYAVDAAFFAPIQKRLNIPSIVSLYGYDVSSFPNAVGGLGRIFVKRAFESMDYFLAMSEDMKKDALSLGVPEEKVIVHYHGINAERFRYDDRVYDNKDTYNILCVGSLEPKKGQHHLIRSVARLIEQRADINVKLTFVGKGPMVKECAAIVKQLGLNDRVWFAGYVPHLDPSLVQFYRDADVFVHFSTTQPDGDKEGIPGTVIEAMASGLPVITTYHAGIPEVIADGEHGILLREGDVEGIARSLMTLHDDNDLRRKLGRAAASRSLNELDVRTKTAALERIYDEVASANLKLKSKRLRSNRPDLTTKEYH